MGRQDFLGLFLVFFCFKIIQHGLVKLTKAEDMHGFFGTVFFILELLFNETSRLCLCFVLRFHYAQGFWGLLKLVSLLCIHMT